MWNVSWSYWTWIVRMFIRIRLDTVSFFLNKNTETLEKKNGHCDCSPWAHRELTVTKMVTASCDWAVTWAVIELWPSRDWAVIILKMPWLSCDLAVTELWPLLAMTKPWSLGPEPWPPWSPWAHRELTVSSPWHFFSHGKTYSAHHCFMT